MKQLLLIINPVAGMKKASRQLIEIISVFNRAGYNTQVYVTSQHGDATKAVQELGKEKDIIVCCGGDGTLNETVTGLIEGGMRIPIGYIPAGSTNDFAASLQLQGDVVAAAKQIVNGTAVSYDVGKFLNRYFSYVASFGAFTKTSYTTAQNIKNILGHLAYVLDGIQEISNIHKEHVRVELEGEVLEDDYLFGAICNSTSVGGVLTLNPEYVDMSDGRFEVILIRAPKDLQELHECIVAIRNKTYNCGMITFRSAKEISVAGSRNMMWSLDGERAEAEERIEIVNLHNCIEIVH